MRDGGAVGGFVGLSALLRQQNWRRSGDHAPAERASWKALRQTEVSFIKHNWYHQP
jgi:hypothetical protein